MPDAGESVSRDGPRIALIDLQALDGAPPPAALTRLLGAAGERASDRSSHDNHFWKELVVEAAIRAPWAPPRVPVRGISLKPPAEDFLRRALRVLSMVHELHKAGYQRIQISPGLAPSGCYWRCNITYAGNIAEDGYTLLKEEDGLVAYYSTGNENENFGLKGAANLNARELAVRFLSAFPRIAERGAGRDWLYAGWLTDVLGRAEQGRAEDFPVFYADYELNTEMIKAWSPPQICDSECGE
jgi:hypothetical protein